MADLRGKVSFQCEAVDFMSKGRVKNNKKMVHCLACFMTFSPKFTLSLYFLASNCAAMNTYSTSYMHNLYGRFASSPAEIKLITNTRETSAGLTHFMVTSFVIIIPS